MVMQQNIGAGRDMRYPARVADAPAGAPVRVAYQSTRLRRVVRFANDPRVAGANAAVETNGFIAAQSHSNSAFGGATSDALVNEARKYIGTNPTGRSRQWCGAFMDMVLKRTGHAGGGNLAWDYSHYGRRVAGPQVGAIAVMHGHVGVVSGLDANGNPIVVSGNHNRTVAESVYPRSRIAAYVMPN